MSAEDLDNPISYEQLEDLEDDFEQVELELREYYSWHHFPLPHEEKSNC